jgi:hypothetical protein
MEKKKNPTSRFDLVWFKLNGLVPSQNDKNDKKTTSSTIGAFVGAGSLKSCESCSS